MAQNQKRIATLQKIYCLPGRILKNPNIAANSEKISVNEKSADFDEILVKKLAAKKMFNAAKQIQNESENSAEKDENTKSEEMPNILTAQNIILDTKQKILFNSKQMKIKT